MQKILRSYFLPSKNVGVLAFIHCDPRDEKEFREEFQERPGALPHNEPAVSPLVNMEEKLLSPIFNA